MGEKKGGEGSYDLEYKAVEDDAWYSVSVTLDTVSQSLILKYLCSPDVYQVTFSAADFTTEAEVDKLATRFRPISHQVQDNQCGKLSVGTTVCASHGAAEDDLRFYDAVIEAVNHQAHSFSGEEEECLCSFVLFWLHGRGRGTLTSANIGSICVLESLSKIDSRISAFVILAKEKVSSSHSTCGLHSSIGSSSNKRYISMSIEKKMESSQTKLLGNETSMTNNILIPQNTWRINDYEQWTSEDEDLGPQHCNIDYLALGKHHHLILIHNLENDLFPSSIKKFIYKKTNIMPQAFVFPRQLADPFSRGAIVVDCQKKVQIIYEFLANSNHIIVSSRGRPWVITEKTLTGTSRIISRNILLTMNLDEIQYKANEELKVICSGTESYDRATALRDLFVEYMYHESQVCNQLILEEKKIRSSFKLGKSF